MDPGRHAPDLRRYAVNPRAIKCPACGCSVQTKPLGGHCVAVCVAKVKVNMRRELRRCDQMLYILRDDEGGTYAVPMTAAQYKQLCQYEAAHRTLPAPAAILKHLGLEAA